ncbi:MAG: hypothetical protein V1754_07755 [Pseudomonadota bacterium]
MIRICITLGFVALMLPSVLFAQEQGYGQPPPGYEEQQAAQAQPPPPPPPPDPKVLRKLRIQFEREPTVKEVQAEALKFFKVHPEKVDGFRAGAKWKALVPDLEVTFNNDRGSGDRRLVDMIYSTKWPDGKDFEYTNNATMYLSVRAHWSLERLVFNPELLDVTSLVGVQESLLREITSLYFTRRRLMSILALNPPQDPGEKLTEAIRLGEITGNLDALTGGYFSDEVKRRVGHE